LETNGFARFVVKKNSANVWEWDISEENKGKPLYVLYTGTESSEEKEICRNVYNGDWKYVPSTISKKLKKISRNNNTGQIIKVFMITSSGSEGINLKNTRYVHIMEPYWHPVRLEQVIGRARRICSHKDLPKELQTVEVFVYVMKFSAKQLKSDDSIELKLKDKSKFPPYNPVTSDQLLYEISEIKSNLTRQLTDVIKETAFDCNIYNNGKCMSFGEPSNADFSYVPEYDKQQTDVIAQANKKEVIWTGKPITIKGKEYVYRRISDTLLNIYDKQSYLDATKNNDGRGVVMVGTLEKMGDGQMKFNPLAT
jgi:hypothetical protein